MFRTGLVSVSFREKSPSEIVKAAKDAGLCSVEWGSDVHAPRDDKENLKYVAKITEDAGLKVASYGSYFRLGTHDVSLLHEYIEAAKILGTDIIRVWAGAKNHEDYSKEELFTLYSECRKAAKIAESSGVTLCCECHNKTLTNSKNGALELMRAVDSSSFLMYWQPNQFRNFEENVEYAKAIAKYTKQIHVFNWRENEKFPLEEAVSEWQTYLENFTGDHDLLLEFMPDGKLETLNREAMSLRKIMEDKK